MTDDLPTWRGPRGGSGCDNPDCEASDRYVRVLSREEIERVYINPDRLPMWPLPQQYTHMCTRCGHAYAGYVEPAGFDRETSLDDRPDVPSDAWDWDASDGWELSVREAVERFIEGAPADAADAPLVTADQIAEGVDRHVPGASAAFAREVLSDMDLDVTASPAADFL